MRKIYVKAILFWFVLLIIALINATLRELTYKPLLEPYIGIWAHQISSVTAILFFFIAIFFFIRNSKEKFSKKELIIIGSIWVLLTVLFETLMNFFLRKISLIQTLQTYYFWNGETWIFVLISLIVSPLIVRKILKNK